MNVDVAATVGSEFVTIAEVDAREHALRAGGSAGALPRPGTSEARQLRRWITQVLVAAERVVAAEASALCARDEDAPAERELLPDEVARLEIGSVAAATLSEPRGRAVFARVTAAVRIRDVEVRITTAATRSVSRAVRRRPGAGTTRPSAPTSTTCDPYRRPFAGRRPTPRIPSVAGRAMRRSRGARPGYEHPGDPRQPDNTHRH